MHTGESYSSQGQSPRNRAVNYGDGKGLIFLAIDGFRITPAYPPSAKARSGSARASISKPTSASANELVSPLLRSWDEQKQFDDCG
jgi:hypothetical protein